MLFLYFPIDESQTARVYMGHVLGFEDYDEEDEIDVRTNGFDWKEETPDSWFHLRRYSGGWAYRDNLDVIDASLVCPD